jgi:hypothetical protein
MNGLCSLGCSAEGIEAQNPHSKFPVDRSILRSPFLPFSRKHYELLCNRLHLPTATTRILVDHITTSSTPHFQIHNLTTEGENESTRQSKDARDQIG